MCQLSVGRGGMSDNLTVQQGGARQQISALERELSAQVLGQTAVVRQLLIGLLCSGHVLLEGFPGTAKTRTVRRLAAMLGASAGRIQFTPDLLPADITGTEVYHPQRDEQRLVFEPGPIFKQLVLADEINRAPAKVQSALLEAMEERQVTAAGTSHPLPQPFMVIATQNPLEQEGTYPLPEAQLDRFLLKIKLDYPDRAAELAMLKLVGNEQRHAWQPSAVVGIEAVEQAQREVLEVTVAPLIEAYMVDIVMATRHCDRYQPPLAGALLAGVSPRATLALHRASRAHAWLDGREAVLPDDVRAVAPAVLRHRLLLSYRAQAGGVDVDSLVEALLAQVAIG